MVRLVLIVDWDPIGVLGHPNALDEYDNYADGIVTLLRSGANRQALAEHLYAIERDWMAFRGALYPNLLLVADKLLSVFSKIED